MSLRYDIYSYNYFCCAIYYVPQVYTILNGFAYMWLAAEEIK